jgi:hypothetical protein
MSSHRETTTARNEAVQLAGESNAQLDKEQAFLEATEEASRAAREIAEAAQAKFEGVKCRNEIERQRFEMQATLAENLAQIEDEINDV